MVDANSLFEGALDLPEDKRAELALRILWSLEAPDPNGHLSDAEFVAELRRRADDAASGKTKGIPWEDVRAELLAKINR